MATRDFLVVVRGALMATVFVALWVTLAFFASRYDARIPVAPPAWLVPLGWIALVAGACTGLACVFLFLTQGKGTPAPFDPPKIFVATGPYRWVRNPMYVGAVTALWGAALAFRSISIALLAIVFWGIAHVMTVRIEEPDLERRFGASFGEYARRTNRWIPWMPRP